MIKYDYIFGKKGEAAMKNKKGYMISLFVIACILVNYIGKIIAANLELPLWLDSIGTVFSAYALGPICGAIVGVTTNIIYGIWHSFDYISYSAVSIAIGVVVGICAEKGYIQHMFGILSTGFLVTLCSVFISVPMNFLFFQGNIGNVWGDGVAKLFKELGFHKVLCSLIGQYYIDFLDKVVAILLLAMCIKIYRKYRDNHKQKEMYKNITTFLLCGLLVAQMFVPVTLAYGENNNEPRKQEEDVKEGRSDFDTYVQTLYKGEDELLGGTAQDIAQTKDGVLWIGTYGGLYRYNGQKFQLMNQFDTVKNVNCLYTDEAGRLWIGSNDSGLSICINETISNTLSKENGMPSNSIRCVTQGSEGNYYVGTTDSLAIVTLSSGLSICDIIPEIVYATSMSADQNGNVAVVNNEGILYLVKGNQILDQVKLKEGITYSSCTFDEMGRLYAGTSGNEVHCYHIENGRLRKKNTISCERLHGIKFIYFSEEKLGFVCADNGVGYFDLTGEFNEIHTNEFNNSIEHMLVDYQGNLWFTSSRQGLLRLCKSVFVDIYKETGIEDKVVNSTTKWEGSLYFGTDQGVDKVDATSMEKKTDYITQRFEGMRVRSLKVDSKNHLWVCTSGNGIFEIQKNGEIKNYNESNGTLGNKFRIVLERKDGTIVAAGDSGITFIKAGTVIATIGSKEGLKNTKTICLLEQEDGTVLAGTDGNGIAVIEGEKISKYYKREDGLSSEVILRMIPDSEKTGIFIVTSNGISYLKQNGHIKTFKSFPYYNNFDIVEGDDNTLFVLSSAGIYVVDKNQLISGTDLDYELLDSKKGLNKALTPNSWNYLDEDGNLYLSTDKGVLAMNLSRYQMSTRSYRMILKKIKVDDASYSITRGEIIHLERGAKKVELIPEVVNYSLNDPYIRVWLEGFDSTPKLMLQSELSNVVYTNLPTGEYILHLAALDSKGNRVIAESTYNLVKEKEIYDNWWFVFYVVFIFIITIIYLTWLFVRTQIHRTLAMQKKELDLAQKQVEMGNETILTIAKTVDARDVNTSQHSVRVSEYSVMIAQKLSFSNKACEELRKMALLHDIGKIGIPDNVLNKPSRLTDEEYEIMKSHVVKGANILKSFTLVKGVEEGAMYHHERFDGRGYVHGLKGEEIPLNARIIGIADAFDAMTANRVYRKQLDFDFVLEELRKGKGTQFDPKLVDIMLELIDSGTIDVEKLYEKSCQRSDE